MRFAQIHGERETRVRHLIEQHLERVGPRRSLLLTVMAIIWASIAVAVVVWALAKGFMESLWITLSVISGDPIDISVAVVLWAFLLLTVPLVRAVVVIWKTRQDERWEANTALDQLEERLFEDPSSTRHLDSPRERLAQHALADLELRILGAPQQDGSGCEARLIELAHHEKRRPPE